MQTCSRCNSFSPDTAEICANCKSNLRELSTSAVALKNFRVNPRVTAIRVNVANDACPLCYESRGTFPKDETPTLPHEGCSHNHGCRCTYEPILSEVYP
ncbi:MAG: hypothetical protein NT121_10970 [Chloroflexi bacterium]|nr:hypothetical protein [Chloroflexota bacterium]